MGQTRKTSRMADFHKAFDRSLPGKGGYSEDPDLDGEIYRGIARRFHPSWEGWPIIDALRFAASSDEEFSRTLEQNQRLKEQVRNFFKQTYWDRFWGDRIPNQEIAEELLETSAEMGVRGAVRCLQESLNLLKAPQKDYPHIFEDGLLGPKTLWALEAYLKIDSAPYLLNVMRIVQGMRHIEKMRRNPNERDAKDWFERISVSKESVAIPPAPPTNIRVE